MHFSEHLFIVTTFQAAFVNCEQRFVECY